MDFDAWPKLPEIRAPKPPGTRRSWDNETYEARYVRQHHDLLEATSRIAAAVGYQKTQVSDVVAAANVSKRVFYEHFNSKGDCFAELVRRIEVAYVKRYIALAEQLIPGDPHAVILRLLHEEVTGVRSNAGLTRALFEVTIAQPRAWDAPGPPALDLMSHLYAVVARRLGSTLDDAALVGTSLVLRQGYLTFLPHVVADELDLGLVAELWCRAFALDDAAGRSTPTKRRPRT